MSAASKSAPVFVLGVPRSGTTLLRLLLAGHPRLFSPPEMVLAPFETMAQRHAALEQRYWEKGGLRRTFMELEGLDVDAAKQRVDGLIDQPVRAVYHLLMELAGDRTLVDKCPHLCGEPEALRRLDSWFPGAHYLWIMRHPGSTIRSFQNVNLSESLRVAYGEPEEVWRKGTETIRDFLATVPSHRWTMFRYEDMVREPEAIMRRVCASLGLEFAPTMLDPYAGGRMLEGPPGARAVGDPNTALHDRIDPTLADRWLASFDPRKVDDTTKVLARTYGYDLEGGGALPRVRASEAFAALLDQAKVLESEVDMPAEVDDIEGRRFIWRVLASSIDTLVEYADPDRPQWHAFIGPTRKLFGDCPDCHYLRAPLRLGPGRTYRLTGRLPSPLTYLGFVLHGRGGRLGAHLNHRQLRADAEGRFEVILSTEPPPDGHVWLRGEGDESEVVVRQYIGDRRAELPIALNLELMSGAPPVAPLDAATYAGGLERASRMLSTVVTRVRRAHDTMAALPARQFYTLPADGLFPTPDNLYQACWYRFGPERAFVVRGRLPRAAYFSLCLYNSWMESLDATRFTVSLNHTQLRTDAEGRFVVVLAESDPGVPNWLQTSGHLAGYLLARSLLLEGPPPEYTTETVWLSELSTNLKTGATEGVPSVSSVP